MPSFFGLLAWFLLGQNRRAYALIAVGTMFAGPGMVRLLLPSIIAHLYQAPFPTDEALGFFEGSYTGATPWLWWLPILWRPIVLILAMSVLTLGATVLLSRSWESERLPYPSVSMPKLKPSCALGILPWAILDAIPPFSAGPVAVRVWPSMTAILFMAPGTVLLTCWVSRLALLYAPVGLDELSVGAFLASLGLILWRYGRLLLPVLIVASCAFLGASLQYPVLPILMTIAWAIVYARMRAESGIPVLWAFPWGLQSKLPWLTRGPWASQGAWLLEGRQTGLNKGQLIGAAALGLSCAIGFTLRASYEYGAHLLNGTGYTGGNMWVDYALSPQGWTVSYRALWGACAILTLYWLRRYWLTCPFHPLGFLLATTWQGSLWACCLIAWGVQRVIVRLGGYKLWRKSEAPAWGAVLAHYALAGARSLAGRRGTMFG